MRANNTNNTTNNARATASSRRGRTPPDISHLHSIMVFNISYRTRKEELYRAFDKYGDIADVYIPRDRYGESRGFGFVRFYDKRDAEDAKGMDGRMLDGRRIGVQMAKYGRRHEQSAYRGGGFKSDRRNSSHSRSRSRSRGRGRYESRSRSASNERYRHRYNSRSRSRSHNSASPSSRNHHRRRSFSRSPRSRSPSYKSRDNNGNNNNNNNYNSQHNNGGRDRDHRRSHRGDRSRNENNNGTHSNDNNDDVTRQTTIADHQQTMAQAPTITHTAAAMNGLQQPITNSAVQQSIIPQTTVLSAPIMTLPPQIAITAVPQSDVLGVGGSTDVNESALNNIMAIDPQNIGIPIAPPPVTQIPNTNL